jgi:hypothetical protein
MYRASMAGFTPASHAAVFTRLGGFAMTTRGILFQARAKFTHGSGTSVPTSKLAITYKPGSDGKYTTCLAQTGTTVCSALALDEDFIWRAANFVALGKSRAFTLIYDRVPNRAGAMRAVQKDGMVLSDPNEGEFVSKSLNEPRLISLLRYIDYGSAFAGPDDTALAKQISVRLGYKQSDVDRWLSDDASTNETDIPDVTDGSYINSDLDSNFACDLSAVVVCSGTPYRYHWATLEGKTNAFVHNVQPAATVAEARAKLDDKRRELQSDIQKIEALQKAEKSPNNRVGSNSAKTPRAASPFLAELLHHAKEQLKDLPSDDYQEKAVALYQTIAIFRAFAVENPDALVKYLDNIGGVRNLVPPDVVAAN